MQVDSNWIIALPASTWSIIIPVFISVVVGKTLPYPWAIKTAWKTWLYNSWILISTIMILYQTGVCSVALSNQNWSFDDKLCIFYNLIIFASTMLYIVQLLLLFVNTSFRKNKFIKVFTKIMTYIICWFGIIEILILSR